MTLPVGHSPGLQQELHLGTVLDNVDPDSRGRVRVRLHATGLEAWAAVMVASAGNGYGVSLLPRVDEQVVLAFAAPDLPIVLGALWTGAAPPPDSAAPVEQRYLLRTPSGLQVLMDDAAPSVDIRTPAGHHVTLTDAGGGQATVEMAGEKIELAPGRITITGSARVEVNASQVNVSAGMVQVDAGMSRFSGVVQCETLITQSVVSAAYTPGAGNIW
jgi:uncharacterized protein involved in type VI secretion and phage assembly